MANIMRFGGGGGGKSYGTLPEQVSGLAATAGNGRAVLSWTNPTSDWAGTKIVRKPASCPQSAGDGVTVYDGTATACTDTGLTNGAVYCYRPFTYNAAKDVQTIMSSVTVTPVEPPKGQALSALNVGDKLKFGSIFGNKIVQRVANKADNLVTLITDGIVFRGELDAKEPKNTKKSLQEYGNPYYPQSNIQQWLNSSAGAGQWYKAQHSADEPPAYDKFAGYLNEWTSDEIDKLQTRDIICKTFMYQIGSGEHMENLDKAEMLSTKIYLYSFNDSLNLFDNLVNRYENHPELSLKERTVHWGRASCTDDCKKQFNADYESYWTRGVNQIGDGDEYTYSISTTTEDMNFGTIIKPSRTYSCNGSGIRPICNLLPSTLVSLQPDADGCYTVI